MEAIKLKMRKELDKWLGEVYNSVLDAKYEVRLKQNGKLIWLTDGTLIKVTTNSAINYESIPATISIFVFFDGPPYDDYHTQFHHNKKTLDINNNWSMFPLIGFKKQNNAYSLSEIKEIVFNPKRYAKIKPGS